MDPNETLRQLRVWAKYTDSEAADLFRVMDDWLSKGGYPPTAWNTNSDAWMYSDSDMKRLETER